MLTTETSCITKTEIYLKEQLKGIESGHGWYHIDRVRKMAVAIAKKYQERNEVKLDLEAIELGALLHDLSDYKFNGGDEYAGVDAAAKFLKSLDSSEELVEKVKNIVQSVTFKGTAESNIADSIEAKIVQDADRLDAIGAIGIARAFNYGGHKGREMYDPDEVPNTNMTWQEYKSNKSSTISHFYEKLFHLKDKLNTNEAKELAKSRHELMVDFVRQFKLEWNSEDLFNKTD